MSNMDDDLLQAARDKVDTLKNRARAYRQAADEAADEVRRAEEAVEMLERLRHEQDNFNKAAGEAFGL